VTPEGEHHSIGVIGVVAEQPLGELGAIVDELMEERIQLVNVCARGTPSVREEEFTLRVGKPVAYFVAKTGK